MTEEDQLLTIREMCDLYDVTPRTLRFYEAKELIAPKRVGQKRLYDRTCKARLVLILRGKRFGFSLEDIRQLLDLYYLDDQQRTQMNRTFEMGRDRLHEMRSQRDQLNETITELENQLKWVANILDRPLNEDTKEAAA